MPFDNRIMKMKHRSRIAPHIAKIDGYWRVSPKPIKMRVDSRFGPQILWDKAHVMVIVLNGKIIEKVD